MMRMTMSMETGRRRRRRRKKRRRRRKIFGKKERETKERGVLQQSHIYYNY